MGAQHSRALKVFPSLTDEQYVLTINQLSNSLVRGSASSLFLDRGENFTQSRTYQPGDPTNSIDWKASARSRDLVVKEYESLRQTVVTLIVDRSGSMTSGSAEASKYAAACILCGGLALAALKAGNPVALVLSDSQDHAPATLSSAKLSARLATMRNFPYRDRTPLSRCLSQGLQKANRTRLVFILSDFHDACARSEIALLATQHELVLVRLIDPVETRTPSAATILLSPAEGGPAVYTRRQAPHPGVTDGAIAALGLPTVTIDPGQPVSRQLRNFFTVQSARR